MADMFITLGTWNWLIFGFILMALELTAPGVFLFWLGLAALLVGLVSFADRRTAFLSRRGAADLAGGLPQLGEVLDRDDDLELDRLGRTAAGRPRRRGRRRGTGRPPRPDGPSRFSPTRWAGCSSRWVEAFQRRAPGGRRAWSRPPHGPRRRSRSRSRAATRGPGLVRIRNSDSGVVMRMSGGVRGGGARPPGCRRTGAPTVRSGSDSPSRVAACRMPASGARRLRSTSTASAFIGLM